MQVTICCNRLSEKLVILWILNEIHYSTAGAKQNSQYDRLLNFTTLEFLRHHVLQCLASVSRNKKNIRLLEQILIVIRVILRISFQSTFILKAAFRNDTSAMIPNFCWWRHDYLWAPHIYRYSCSKLCYDIVVCNWAVKSIGFALNQNDEIFVEAFLILL